MLTLQIRCEGPIGGLTVTADARGNVKGAMANQPDVLPPNAKEKLDVGGVGATAPAERHRGYGPKKKSPMGQTALQTERSPRI